MTDYAKLTKDELVAKLMEAVREGWPVPMEDCRDEILRRLTPTGDVGDTLELMTTVINAPIQDGATQAGIKAGLIVLRTEIASMQADRPALEAGLVSERIKELNLIIKTMEENIQVLEAECDK